MSELSSLLKLLTEACSVVENEYAKTSKPLPSLDDLEPHPLDTQIYPTELRKAVRIIEASAAQIIALCGRPDHVINNVNKSFSSHIILKCVSAYETGCLRTAAEAKVADVLLQHPSGLSVSVIAEKCKALLQRGYVARKGVKRDVLFAQTNTVSPNVFANNRLSLQLASGTPMYSCIALLTDENSRSLLSLSDAINDPEWAHSDAPNHSAFNKWTGYPERYFSWLENTPEGRRRAARFGASMVGWSQSTDALSVVKHFPWDSLPEGAIVNDYGGGNGSVIAQIAKVYPHLRFILQDTAAELEIAKTKYWPENSPAALKEGRVEFKVVDFLTESPVSGCDIYYLKNVLHDWPDKEALKILKLITPALKPGSRVLLHEYVIQPVCRLTNTLFPQADPPLLPNWGLGGIRAYNQNVNMLSLFNSGEREFSSFVALGEQAGLRFVKIWDLMEGVVLEFRLK